MTHDKGTIGFLAELNQAECRRPERPVQQRRSRIALCRTIGGRPAREHDSRLASSTPDGGRGFRWVCIAATGEHPPPQDMIGSARTKPSGSATMTGYGNARRPEARRTAKLLQHKANPHPTHAREVCVWKFTPGRTTGGPNRRSSPLRPARTHAAWQEPEKPPENDHQQMHRLIDSPHAGWLLLLNTEFVENSFRTVSRLRFPCGPPKTLVM